MLEQVGSEFAAFSNWVGPSIPEKLSVPQTVIEALFTQLYPDLFKEREILQAVKTVESWCRGTGSYQLDADLWVRTVLAAFDETGIQATPLEIVVQGRERHTHGPYTGRPDDSIRWD